jgi:hypothetical protein
MRATVPPIRQLALRETLIVHIADHRVAKNWKQPTTTLEVKIGQVRQMDTGVHLTDLTPNYELKTKRADRDSPF